MLTREEYFEHRSQLQQQSEALTWLEQHYMDFLVSVVLDAAPTLHADFSRSRDLVPCWISYSPKQRGRAPVGDSQPWSEVGEK
ncbi:MAG: BglI family type II restriction endonuclease [Abitibacteriaceae bacterium]|nr:BglI family type II restriction endonuclease [Abditibacteriaceae bacterium]MBV9866174.1 BglI family type II restriction endonuclease [Abditibacteriaceae bacterium]